MTGRLSRWKTTTGIEVSIAAEDSLRKIADFKTLLQIFNRFGGASGSRLYETPNRGERPTGRMGRPETAT